MIDFSLDWSILSILICGYLFTFGIGTALVRKVVEILNDLFSLKLGYKQYLKDGIIHERLRRAFKDNGYQLPPEAIISKINNDRWEIWDGKKSYLIEDTGTELNISRSRKKKQKIIDTGFVIGICESFIVITLILANEITGLGLVFAAKTIVRYKDISNFPEYFLAGTMVNFTFSLLMGMIIKYLIIC